MTGIGISGSNNVVRNNVVVESIGACIRLGGAEVDGVQYGINNEVRYRGPSYNTCGRSQTRGFHSGVGKTFLVSGPIW